MKDATTKSPSEPVGESAGTSSGEALNQSTPESENAPANVRVTLPHHLKTLARVDGEVTLAVEPPVTQRTILDALEAAYPMLRGTIREHGTQKRRPRVRFFASEEDVSHDDPDAPLPDAIASGRKPFMVIGAISGG